MEFEVRRQNLKEVILKSLNRVMLRIVVTTQNDSYFTSHVQSTTKEAKFSKTLFENYFPNSLLLDLMPNMLIDTSNLFQILYDFTIKFLNHSYYF